MLLLFFTFKNGHISFFFNKYFWQDIRVNQPSIDSENPRIAFTIKHPTDYTWQNSSCNRRFCTDWLTQDHIGEICRGYDHQNMDENCVRCPMCESETFKDGGRRNMACKGEYRVSENFTLVSGTPWCSGRWSVRCPENGEHWCCTAKG